MQSGGAKKFELLAELESLQARDLPSLQILTIDSFRTVPLHPENPHSLQQPDRAENAPVLHSNLVTHAETLEA